MTVGFHADHWFHVILWLSSGIFKLLVQMGWLGCGNSEGQTEPFPLSRCKAASRLLARERTRTREKQQTPAGVLTAGQGLARALGLEERLVHVGWFRPRSGQGPSRMGLALSGPRDSLLLSALPVLFLRDFTSSPKTLLPHLHSPCAVPGCPLQRLR